ncbi:DUF6516 family protein [Massilia sp. SR12]
MRKQRKFEKRSNIPFALGNGEIHYELWIDEAGNITRYNLAYINHRLFTKDNGRVVGYDNAHGSPHRHIMGTTEPVDLEDFSDIEACFIRDWQAIVEGSRK